MQQKTIQFAFLFSLIFAQIINSSEQRPSFDVSKVTVDYYRPIFENDDKTPSLAMSSNDAEYAQRALTEAIKRGDVEVSSEDEVSLTYDRQSAEVYVSVIDKDNNGYIDKIK